MTHLPPHLIVGALLRRVNDAGGIAVVRARGDADAGGMLIVAIEGRDQTILEAGSDLTGARVLRAVGPTGTDSFAIEDYWRKRRARDRDLWVVELDVAQAKRFAADSLGTN